MTMHDQRIGDTDDGSGFHAGDQPSELMLGRDVPIPTSPDDAELQAVPNPFPQNDYIARFTVPEFTSLCPVTGQPDFAVLMIDYLPGAFLLESKSLKLFAFAHRNHRGFHEKVTVNFGKRIVEAIQPKWLRLGGYWYPRGGIPIDVFFQHGEHPRGMWIPDQRIPQFRGR